MGCIFEHFFFKPLASIFSCGRVPVTSHENALYSLDELLTNEKSGQTCETKYSISLLGIGYRASVVSPSKRKERLPSHSAAEALINVLVVGH